MLQQLINLVMYKENGGNDNWNIETRLLGKNKTRIKISKCLQNKN